MNDVAIRVEGLSKYYKLGVINNGAIFRDLQSWWALKRGKADPHAKIGSHNDGSKDGFWALSDLNFDIKQGDRVGIIGHNGAGKSTLLKILSGITVPTKGIVKINGKVSSLLEVGTGFHGELTGRENIYLNGAILGMKKCEVDAKIDEIISFSEIEQHIDTPVKRYSSGMYVRLAFAVAAHLDSDILIADEVLAVGDAAFQKKALSKMGELSTGQGRTVLFVSHNISAVKGLCNKGIVLEKGKVVREDDEIQKSIDWYLGKKDDNSDIKTTSWYNDGRVYDESFNPFSLEILDENEKIVTDALKYEKEYKVRLTVDVKRPDTNVDFWICAYLGNEIISYWLMPPGFSYKKGKNVLDFIIPKKSLVPNYYLFSLGSSLKNVKWIVNPSNFDITISTHIVGEIKKIFKTIAR